MEHKFSNARFHFGHQTCVAVGLPCTFLKYFMLGCKTTASTKWSLVSLAKYHVSSFPYVGRRELSKEKQPNHFYILDNRPSVTISSVYHTAEYFF